MKTLTVEWKHLDQDGGTGIRCGDPGQSRPRIVQARRRQCRPHGSAIKFIEMKLP